MPQHCYLMKKQSSFQLPRYAANDDNMLFKLRLVSIENPEITTPHGGKVSKNLTAIVQLMTKQGSDMLPHRNPLPALPIEALNRLQQGILNRLGGRHAHGAPAKSDIRSAKE